MQESGGLKFVQALDALLDSVTALMDQHSSMCLQPSDLPFLDVIDTKLHHLSTYTRTLRNTASCINRLPSELLGSIFHYACRARQHNDTTMWTLITITQVCHHWRAISTSQPLLWSRILVDGSWMSEAFSRISLRRSLSAPLEVVIKRIPWRSDAPVRRVALQAGRIAKLRIGGSMAETVGVAKYFHAPAPELEELVLDTEDGVVGTPPAELPLLFGGDTPRLRRLTVRRWNMVSAPQFQNLAKLVLKHQRYERAEELASLVRLLHASPQLASLSFQRVFFPHRQELLDRRVQLRCLKRFYCGPCSLHDANFAFVLLDLPDCVAISLDIDLSDESATHITADLQSFALPHVNSVTHLCISSNTRTTRLTGASGSAEGAYSFHLALHGAYAEAARVAVAGAVFGALSLGRIRELRLMGDVTPWLPFWDGAVTQLGALMRLVVHLETLHSVDVLERLLGDTPVGQGVPCPDMEELALVEEKWAARDVVERLLKERQRAGKELSMLRVQTYSDVPSHVGWRAWAQTLRPLVGLVVFEEFEELPEMTGPEAWKSLSVDQGHWA